MTREPVRAPWFRSLRAYWLGRPFAWGFWPCSNELLWIFDVGPLRFLRLSGATNSQEQTDD